MRWPEIVGSRSSIVTSTHSPSLKKGNKVQINFRVTVKKFDGKYKPPKPETEDAGVVPGETLMSWNDISKPFLVLGQRRQRGQEPAVAQLALLHVEAVCVVHEELWFF